MSFGAINNKYENRQYDYISRKKVADSMVSTQQKMMLPEKATDTETLGIAFLNVGNGVSYGLSAFYAPNSTAENPIIKVEITNGKNHVETYEININEINPSNATGIEMFALCNYADSIGKGTSSTFGSWNTLKNFAFNAQEMGEFNIAGSVEEFISLKQDWSKMAENMTSTYMQAGIYKQALDGQCLAYIFDMCTSLDEKIKSARMIPIENGEDGIARLEHGIKKIVTAVNPEDGKEYLTYFTKDTIVCKSTEGSDEVVWTMEITEEQAELINKYFEKHQAVQEGEPSWYTDADLGMVSSKEFWYGFFEGAGLEEDSTEISDEEYRELLAKQIEKLQEKIENGDTEETFQIGAQTFTVKEWKEFLDKFDSIQEVMEELMRERHKLQEKEKIENEREKNDSEDETAVVEMLFSEIIETKNTEVKVSNFKEYETANYQFIPEQESNML